MALSDTQVRQLRAKLDSHSKALKPMQPNVLSPPLAIPLDLRFTIVSRSVSAKCAVEGMRRQSVHGSCARRRGPMKRALINRVNLPRLFARR
jgi:hypothetical protein